MNTTISKHISALGLSLPEPNTPIANYTPWLISDSLLFISGQLPVCPNNGLVKGCLGKNRSLDDGRAAARLCALSMIAQINAALDSLDNVRRIVKIGGFVCASPDFLAIPDVINGCSDLMVEVFGPHIGTHTRSAVACTALPLGALVETDAVVEIA